MPNEKDAGNRLIMPRYDVAFKSIFKGEDSKDVVEGFLKAVLDIPKSVPFEEIQVRDSELLPDAGGEKVSVLDVLLKIRGMGTVNVEMQLCSLPGMKERLVYYWAKIAARQLASGQSYTEFNKVITVVITDFNFISDSDSYHHRYLLYDKEHNSQFTELIEFDILELKKLPAKTDHSEKWKWAKFFRSGSDAELHEAAKGSKEITKAMLTIEKLSADEAAWTQALYEEKQRRDYISRVEGAKREGLAEGRAEGLVEGEAKGRAENRAEIARRMAALGKSEAEIAEILGGDKER